MSPETEIRAPIAGTIVQRKVGLGQYLASGSDPAFVIGDLSTVWLVANVRETEVPRIKLGQELEASVIGFPTAVFKAKISYMAAPPSIRDAPPAGAGPRSTMPRACCAPRCSRPSRS